jgi:sulfite exporter TauE/SafE
MNPYMLAFFTGLTTGGLSCLAVQGGLLASSLGRQIEQDMLTKGTHGKKGQKNRTRLKSHTALPIILFLTAKVIAYTILGFLLGALGSVLSLNSTVRAILLIAIGIFMVGNALRMLNVHPIFRYFIIEPPSSITRYIRRKAKNDTDFFTPIFLGALTVFIPCGITQAMMAVALATGSALEGAAIMFAFTLGTSPVFFIVAYLTTEMGKKLEGLFMKFVAVVILILGLFSIDSGLTLMGNPYSINNIIQAGLQGPAPRSVTVPLESSATNLVLAAENDGYYPGRLYAKAGVPVSLNVVTDRTVSCARAFVIPALGVETLLPRTGTVPIDIPPQESGTILRFTCSMGMYTGEIVFNQ